MNLAVRDDIQVSDDKLEIEIAKQIDRLLEGIPVAMAVNILVSYLSMSIVNQVGGDGNAAAKMAASFSQGLQKVIRFQLHRYRGIQ